MYSLTDKNTIEYLCKKYDFKFKHGLGQNFLKSEDVLFEIVKAADAENCGILEIGPGFGTLTAAVASASKKVVSVEIDKNLEPVLNETLMGFDNVEVIFEDVLKLDLNELLKEKFGDMEVSVAANLPYYITTPIILKLLEERLPLKNIVVMVQKEVAERICAKSGGKEYGAVTVSVNYYCEPSIVCTVPASLFVPAPKVDSAVLCLRVRKEPPVKLISEEKFFSLIKAAFSQRRKTLVNCLLNSGKFGSKENILSALAEIGADPMIRGERLSIEDFAALSNIFSKI